MSEPLIFVSHDVGLIRHWQQALGNSVRTVAGLGEVSAQEFAGHIVWLDTAVGGLPAWGEPYWRNLAAGRRIIAASSIPTTNEAIAALDSGCVGYVHAFSASKLLLDVDAVVRQGGVWVGQDVMQRLLQSLRPAAESARPPWHAGLSERERFVAALAAEGLANRDIADQCGITERTVKAHLAAIFEKLAVSDRLQLALKVHGIR